MALFIVGHTSARASSVFYLVLRTSAHLLPSIGVTGVLGLLQAYGACGPIEAMKDLQNIIVRSYCGG